MILSTVSHIYIDLDFLISQVENVIFSFIDIKDGIFLGGEWVVLFMWFILFEENW